MKRRSMKGVSLIELMIVLAISMIILVMVITKWREVQRDRLAELQAKQLVTMTNALNGVLAQFYDQWVAASDSGPAALNLVIKKPTGNQVVSVANAWSPKISELVDTRYFPENASDKTFNGGKFVIKVEKVPTGCFAPACNLEAYVCVDKPIRSDGVAGNVDYPRLGLAVKTVGPDGGGAMFDSPGLISGLGAGWSRNNTIVSPANTPGILCMRAGYASSAWSAFFRIDGSRWMTNDANIGGNSTSNVKQVETVVKKLDDPCTVSSIKDSNNAAINQGAISIIRGADGKDMVAICADGKWKPYTGLTGRPGESCVPEGAMATFLDTGEGLICKGGKWVRVQNLVGRQIVQRLVVTDGAVVQKPSCPDGGLPDYQLVLKGGGVDVTVIPPFQVYYATTNDLGSAWGVVIRMRADTGTEKTGNTQNLSAIMNVECKYGF